MKLVMKEDADCDCFVGADNLLRDHNSALLRPLFGKPRAFVETYQLETGRGKKKAAKMLASHCPFCGVKYTS